MPAAAVIPALIAYIKAVAVKKLVVGFWIDMLDLTPGEGRFDMSFFLSKMVFRLNWLGH